MAKKKKNKYSLGELIKQRRVWAAVLSAVAAGAVSLGHLEVASLCVVLAGALGLHSFVKPK
tara:strand:- start:3344 stop:3526 length:183 start_codon:yes stop_codon:yes gene_type:complete